MAPIDVEVEARTRFLLDRGFYDRQVSSAAMFMTPEEVERRTFIDTPTLLATVPGLSLQVLDGFQVSGSEPCPRGWTKVGSTCETDGLHANTPILLTRSAFSSFGPPCRPAIYLDGMVMQTSGAIGEGGPEFDLESVPAADVLALEAYRSAAEVPVEFSGGSSTCGVVIIWTKAQLPAPGPGGPGGSGTGATDGRRLEP